jgi:flagellar biosynthetic protein FliQ
MDAGIVAEIGRESVYLLITISAPVLILALVVGLIISLLQALTQIQETTLTFVPKIIAVYFGMIFILPFMYGKMLVFVDHIMQLIITPYN